MAKMIRSSRAGAALSPKRKQAAPATAADLMAHPRHMLRWLEGKKPRAIVAKNMWDYSICLGATFLQEKGHADARWFASFGRVGEKRLTCCEQITAAIDALCETKTTRNVTAAQAIRAIKLASKGA
jgi:hypothetical protein